MKATLIRQQPKELAEQNISTFKEKPEVAENAKERRKTNYSAVYSVEEEENKVPVEAIKVGGSKSNYDSMPKVQPKPTVKKKDAVDILAVRPRADSAPTLPKKGNYEGLPITEVASSKNYGSLPTGEEKSDAAKETGNYGNLPSNNPYDNLPSFGTSTDLGPKLKVSANNPEIKGNYGALPSEQPLLRSKQVIRKHGSAPVESSSKPANQSQSTWTAASSKSFWQDMDKKSSEDKKQPEQESAPSKGYGGK